MTRKDITGKEMQIGDLVCYSFSYSNRLYMGHVDKFCPVMTRVRGHNPQTYDPMWTDYRKAESMLIVKSVEEL